MRYDDKIKDNVQIANDIVEVISQYVPLKRSGHNFKGLCPFHQEKTPSFMVHPEKQIYHCFGCGAGGDVFSFLMRHDNLSFPEALRQLAERAHIRLPEKTFEKSEGPSENEKLYEIYRLATEFYHRQFLDPSIGRKARDYFEKREFEKSLAEELQLGWAPDAWQGLFEVLSQKGFPESVLLKSGLVHRSPKGNLYDSFRGRLLFPIRNLQGKAVAFGGRLIDDREGPKYLNSSENPIFHKRRELFGLNLAKKFIDRQRPQIVVVEGYFDFLRLYQKGIKAAVATLGTALTDEHVQILKRFAEEAVVAYDGDKAGEAASLRGLEVFLEGAMSVKLIRIEGGLDPDDFVRQKGAEAFQKLIAEARDLFDFKLDVLLGRFSRRDSLGLMRITHEFLETFAKVKNPILLDHYLKRLAGNLGVDENSLRSELTKLKNRINPKDRESAPVKMQEVKTEDASDEILLLALALEKESFRKAAFGELKESDFQDFSTQQLFQMLAAMTQDGEKISWPKILNRIDHDPLKKKLVAISSFEWNDSDKEKAFSDCLKKIKEKRSEERRKELRRLIAQAEREGNEQGMNAFLKEYQSLLRAKK